MKDSIRASITTFSGLSYNYVEPQIEQIEIIDIAVALSREGRFAGHCSEYISVAQHSVLVSEYLEQHFTQEEHANLTPEEAGLVGLLHDASEAYMKDIPSPLKKILPDYRALELKCQDVIFKKFIPQVQWEHSASWYHHLELVDKKVLATEALNLLKHDKAFWERNPWGNYDRIIIPWDPDKAALNFLARYFELVRRLDKIMGC